MQGASRPESAPYKQNRRLDRPAYFPEKDPGVADEVALNQSNISAAALLLPQFGVHAGGKEGFPD